MDLDETLIGVVLGSRWGAQTHNGGAGVSILADAHDREERARRRKAEAGEEEDEERQARPHTKPRRDAQWDEIAGHWVVWDREAEAWVALDDGSVHGPANLTDPEGADPAPAPSPPASP